MEVLRPSGEAACPSSAAKSAAARLPADMVRPSSGGGGWPSVAAKPVPVAEPAAARLRAEENNAWAATSAGDFGVDAFGVVPALGDAASAASAAVREDDLVTAGGVVRTEKALGEPAGDAAFLGDAVGEGGGFGHFGDAAWGAALTGAGAARTAALGDAAAATGAAAACGSSAAPTGVPAAALGDAAAAFGDAAMRSEAISGVGGPCAAVTPVNMTPVAQPH